MLSNMNNSSYENELFTSNRAVLMSKKNVITMLLLANW